MMKPFLVEITEVTKRQVFVVAEDEPHAEVIAEDQADRLAWRETETEFHTRTVTDPLRYRDQVWATGDGPVEGREILKFLGGEIQLVLDL